MLEEDGSSHPLFGIILQYLKYGEKEMSAGIGADAFLSKIE